MKQVFVYSGFLAAFVFATLCATHILLAYKDSPVSTHASASHVFSLISCGILILSSIISVVLLKNKNGSELKAIINWLVMIIGLYSCLVVIVRSATWLCLSEEDKVYDMRNQTVFELQYGEGVDKMFTGVMRNKQCCGIANVLDWSDLKFSAETSTGETVQFSDEAETHRYVPDVCCVEQRPGCGNRAFDDVEDKNLTGAFQMKDHKEFENLLDNRPTDGKTLFLKVLYPLDDMLLYKLKLQLLQNISNSVCSLPEDIQKTKVLYIYYHGMVRKNKEGLLIACRLGEDCENVDYIPYKYPVASVFCSQLDEPQGLGAAFTEEEIIQLLQESGQLYTKGCQDHLITSIDGFCIFSLLYNLAILIILCWEIAAFHEYYWRYKLPQLQAEDKPIFYVAYENEEELLQMAEEVTPLIEPSQPSEVPESQLVSQKPDREPEIS